MKNRNSCPGTQIEVLRGERKGIATGYAGQAGRQKTCINSEEKGGSGGSPVTHSADDFEEAIQPRVQSTSGKVHIGAQMEPAGAHPHRHFEARHRGGLQRRASPVDIPRRTPHDEFHNQLPHASLADLHIPAGAERLAAACHRKSRQHRPHHDFAFRPIIMALVWPKGLKSKTTSNNMTMIINPFGL